MITNFQRSSFAADRRGIMAMKILIRFTFALLGLVPLVLANRVTAAEVQPLEFIHAMEDKGYYEITAEYLNWLKSHPPMPAEVAPVWDLEMSKSLRGSAARAINPQEFEDSMNEAQKHLDKFIKENPKHPEAAGAMESAGLFSIDRALYHLRMARPLTDKAEKTRHLAAARELLAEARPRLQKAADALQQRLTQTPIPEPKRGVRVDRQYQAALAERVQMERSLWNARFQTALSQYYTAQTYDEKGSEDRKAALELAAKQIDAIYQANRLGAAGEVNVIGLYAHMWHGKVVEELGDSSLAAEIYEEVLANEPGARAPANKVLDPLFAQVQQFRFGIMARKDPLAFLTEATAWLKQYAQKDRKTEGYQGIALEVAKTRLELAGEATGSEKSKRINEAVAVLNDMVNVPSPYRQEAWDLRKKYSKAATVNVQGAKTFEEAAAIAESAGMNDQWEQAAAGYARALEIAASVKLKDQKRLTELAAALANAKYMVALRLFQENKLEECMSQVGKLFQEDKRAPAASMAGSLAVAAAFRLFQAVPANETEKQQAALSRLEKIARMTETTWPSKAAADDARMVLAQVSLVQRKFDEAIDVFEKVNPKSERYPLALYWAGLTYWQRYFQNKTSADLAKKAQAAADRVKAVQRATESLAGFQKAADPGKPLSPQHLECQLLIALMHLEGKETKEAAALLQPLVEQVKTAKPDALDDTTVRIFRAALQADLAVGDVAHASEVGMLLCDLGADAPPINAMLVEFARALDGERKKAEAELSRATAAKDSIAAEKAKANLESMQSRLGRLVKKLSARKELSVFGLLTLADLSANLGQSAEAKQGYESVLAIPAPDAQADPNGAAQAKRAATRARAQLIGILRSAGKFDEAIQQAKQLATDNPRALEPQMELGRSLQSRAEKDPAKYEEATNQWIKVRNWLQSVRKRPPEYYEANYNVAWCLYAEAFQTQEKMRERAGEALKFLKAELILNEKLSGPEMVEKYKALVETLEKLRQPTSSAAPTTPRK